jgi:hypothetical protein
MENSTHKAMDNLISDNKLISGSIFQHKGNNNEYLIKKVKGIKQDSGAMKFYVVYSTFELCYIDYFEREITDFIKKFRYLRS